MAPTVFFLKTYKPKRLERENEDEIACEVDFPKNLCGWANGGELMC